jgi:hypothetical protein
MAPGRRTFLKLAGGVCLAPGASAAWWEARDLVRGGSLGRVVFGRVSGNTVGWLRFLCDGAMPVYERGGRDELVLCGTEATLVVDRHGCRRYA